jgi:photosystem II stability/assembly factor-like uncharacterized protein
MSRYAFSDIDFKGRLIPRRKRMKVSLIILAILIVHSTHAQQYSWQVVARPTTIPLTAVVYTDTLNGIIAGGAAGFYVTTDGGSTWTPSAGATFRTEALSMADSSTGWSAGNSGSIGRINHTTDAGRTWVDQRSIAQDRYNGTAAQNVLRNTTAGDKYPGSGPDTSLVVSTTDGGVQWQKRRLNPNTRFSKVVFVDSLHGWINANLNQGSSGAVFRTTDGGANWQQLAAPVLFSAIEFIDTLQGWAGAFAFPGFYRTTDGGVTWDSLYRVPNPPEDFSTNDLSFTDSLYGWAFGGAFYQGRISEAIYHTTNGGVTWYRESIGLTDDLGDLSDGIMLDRTHGWTVAADGRVLAYRLVTSVPERLPDVPTSFSLRQNYPNPFNPTTTIEYELAERTRVRLQVFDNLGREVSVLVNAPQEAGVYRVQFDGSHLASGVYTVVLDTKREKHTRQIVLVK